ncbi:glycoside hydrolase family 25 protein [Dysgonomonas macrotermitis]|uniref:Lysozyme n=1 Tax=Dysgonomonas macrotermitis TaxID=1346286 RepID=A0A1M5DP17_9BACT|nr:GH25 family lysozyme [Dysgonomonas macrotermitis]SHF68710.1 lysozyme [Dysgonomonas macrotermitis]
MRKKKSKQQLKSVICITTLIVVFLSLGYYFYKKNSIANTFDKNTKYSVRGIDISHHNPILNWIEVKNEGVSFAYIKATEGITHDDRNYPYNYKLAKENGVRIGSYHFYNFGVSGREQAKHFIKVATCEPGDLLPAIDVEHSPANPYSKDTLFVRSVIKELKILENELYEYYGHHPIIYTNLDCYKLYINKQFPDNPIWISSLNKEPGDDIENWVIWQFSHKGELTSLDGDVDLNYFRYTIDRISEICLP